jgi:hypothetical protein
MAQMKRSGARATKDRGLRLDLVLMVLQRLGKLSWAETVILMIHTVLSLVAAPALQEHMIEAAALLETAGVLMESSGDAVALLTAAAAYLVREAKLMLLLMAKVNTNSNEDVARRLGHALLPETASGHVFSEQRLVQRSPAPL